MVKSIASVLDSDLFISIPRNAKPAKASITSLRAFNIVDGECVRLNHILPVVLVRNDAQVQTLQVPLLELLEYGILPPSGCCFVPWRASRTYHPDIELVNGRRLPLSQDFEDPWL